MQRRLLHFFQATRAQSDSLEWRFHLRTVDNLMWTESMLAEQGMPAGWLLIIVADADYPFVGRTSRGCFSTHRILRPRKVAWNIPRASRELAVDVLAEFRKRLPEIT